MGPVHVLYYAFNAMRATQHNFNTLISVIKFDHMLPITEEGASSTPNWSVPKLYQNFRRCLLWGRCIPQ